MLNLKSVYIECLNSLTCGLVSFLLLPQGEHGQGLIIHGPVVTVDLVDLISRYIKLCGKYYPVSLQCIRNFRKIDLSFANGILYNCFDR